LNNSTRVLSQLRRLDELISSLSGVSDGAAQNILDQIFANLKTDEGANNVPALLSLERPVEIKSRLVAFLLRILTLRPTVLQGKPWSHLVMQLFDNELKELYRYLKIDMKSQAYERERALLECFSKTVTRLERLSSDAGSLHTLARARETAMRAFRTPDTVAFVLPLLAPELSDASVVIELLNAAIAFSECDPARRFGAHHAFQDAYAQTSVQLHELETDYSRRFFLPLIEATRATVERQFQTDESLQSTSLTLTQIDRKYPLRISNHVFGIGMTICNTGPGIAFDVRLDANSSLGCPLASISLPELGPGNENVSILARTDAEYQEVILECAVTWRCADGTSHASSLIFELQSQREDIQWDEIFADDRYPIDPVTDERHLVGRQGLMKELFTRLSRKKLPSYLLHGQKRVGKTSIVKTLKSIIDNLGEDLYVVVYVESGDFRMTEASSSLEALGSIVASRILAEFPVDLGFELPNFTGSLSPLGSMLDRLTELRPEARFLIIIDEFDELPAELYFRGPIGDTLFLNLRSLSNKGNVGFILIGSEKMDQIQNLQGEHINRWESRKLDYFDRDTHWSDFVALVRKPTEDVLEITNDAIDALYVSTAGNPYFSNILCRQITSNAVARRDAFVAGEQVFAAVREAARTLPASRFAHFWDDGILESGDRKELISVRRRRVLLAIADLLRRGVKNPRAAIYAQDVVRSLGETVINDEIQDLERREILRPGVGGMFSFKVRLFQEWLMESGISEIITRFQDEDAAIAAMREQEVLTVRSEEIVKVARDWIYRGRRISDEQVRAWLQQFGPLLNQRRAFSILEHLRFYSEDTVRAKMKEAFGLFSRRFIEKGTEYFTRRPEFLVTYLDDEAKSGSLMAKYFAEENRLFDGSVISPDRIRAKASTQPSIRAVIAIDDVMGTGKTLVGLLDELMRHSGDLFRSEKLSLYVLAVAGYSPAIRRVRAAFEASNVRGEVIVIDELDASEMCFGESSSTFADAVQRREAEQMIRGQGELLEKKWPVGFGDCQGTLIFAHNAPNTSVPVLWKTKGTWLPLFPRA
jgi:hypothetical protein